MHNGISSIFFFTNSKDFYYSQAENKLGFALYWHAIILVLENGHSSYVR